MGTERRSVHPGRPALQRVPAARAAPRRSARSIRPTATPSCGRSACATAWAAPSTRAPATSGSARTRATGWATTFRATSSIIVVQDRHRLRLPVLPPGRHPRPGLWQGAFLLRVHDAGGEARGARGAAGHEVLHRQPVPGPSTSDNIFIAEHGSWNPPPEERLSDRARDRESLMAPMPARKCSSPASRTARPCSDGRPISSWRPTGRCWSPTIRPAAIYQISYNSSQLTSK